MRANIAYIDGANLDRALGTLGWKLDYCKFRVWLKDKYKIKRAYIFVGFIPKHTRLYAYLRQCGFSLKFKEVVYREGIPKGNCDTNLVLQAIDDAFENRLDKALLVSSDGDYAPLVLKLTQRFQFLAILSPAPAQRCSILLKRTGVSIAYLHDQRSLLEVS